MARGAEARAAMVAGADLGLAKAGVPNPPRHADISRSDLSQPFIQTRGVLKKELTARCVLRGGCVAQRTTTRRVDRGISSIWSPSASAPPRLRIAPCRGIGKETFSPERTTRTSPPSSSAIPASRCSSSSPAKTRRLLLLRSKHIGKLPDELRRSLTWDQGKEMHAHKRFTVPPTSRSTSVIRAVPGSAAQTRTPTACCVSTFREEPTSPASLRVI